MDPDIFERNNFEDIQFVYVGVVNSIGQMTKFLFSILRNKEIISITKEIKDYVS